jgi:histidine ammonia-lyase
MGMTSALKLRQVVENAEHVLAIEMMSATQGLDYRLPLKSAREVEQARVTVRRTVQRLADDRILSTDIERLATEIRAGAFDAWKN